MSDEAGHCSTSLTFEIPLFWQLHILTLFHMEGSGLSKPYRLASTPFHTKWFIQNQPVLHITNNITAMAFTLFTQIACNIPKSCMLHCILIWVVSTPHSIIPNKKLMNSLGWSHIYPIPNPLSLSGGSENQTTLEILIFASSRRWLGHLTIYFFLSKLHLWQSTWEDSLYILFFITVLYSTATIC